MKRRVMSMLLAFVMVVGMVPLLPIQVQAAEATSGKCGDNLTWNLDEDGILTIDGSGPMYDYSTTDKHAPWYSIKSSIKRLYINWGVTSIGDYAFYQCNGLFSVENIPNSIVSIGSGAFWYTSLNSISIPNSVNLIQARTFSNCRWLKRVDLPDSVTSI